MTALLARPTASGSVPVVEGVARVHLVLDEVDAAGVGRVSGRDVAEVDRAMSRMAALKLAMVAAAHRQGAAKQAGMTSTGAWLAAHTRSGGATAAAEVALARALETSLPVTRQALADGVLSTEHAAVIAGTTSRLPEILTGTERSKVETALVAQARHVDPARLRRSARRALAAAERSAEEALAHEDAELRGEESRAARRVRLTMHDNLDGTVTGHFTVPTLAGAILRKAIQQMISPRRHSDAGGIAADARSVGSSDAGGSGSIRFGGSRGRVRSDDGERGTGERGTGERGTGILDVGGLNGIRGDEIRSDGEQRHTRRTSPLGLAEPGDVPSSAGEATPAPSQVRAPAGPAAPRDWAHESGAAFVELLEHLPTDRLSGKVAATVVVTIEHDRLREELGAAHVDTGHDLSAAEARRLACSAGILPAVLDGASLPLDLGRTRRFFTEAQRVALATIYDECAADGCDRPYAWSELHHEHPWAKGGDTDLHLAVPLCGSDHRRAHDPRFETVVRTDASGRKSVAFRRRC